MKLESVKQLKQVLKMEVAVLKKLQGRLTFYMLIRAEPVMNLLIWILWLPELNEVKAELYRAVAKLVCSMYPTRMQNYLMAPASKFCFPPWAPTAKNVLTPPLQPEPISQVNLTLRICSGKKIFLWNSKGILLFECQCSKELNIIFIKLKCGRIKS